MHSNDQIINQFQKTYFEEFGQEISQKEAYEKFLRLVNLLRVVTQPPDQSNLDRNTENATLNHYP